MRSLPSHSRRDLLRTTLAATECSGGLSSSVRAASARSTERRLLYVAVPGIRNYLERGGHGILVFDVDRDHAFVKRIPARGFNAQGEMHHASASL